MTTPEDRLRELLHSEAATVVPTGEGLARIQERVARRRQLRRWLLPSAAVATAAAAAAFFLVVPDPRETQTLQPASPSPGATSTPTPSATASGTPVTTVGHWTGPAYWPFASQQAVEALTGPAPDWATDPVEVVTRLVRDVLDLEGVTARLTCASCDVVSLRVAGDEVGLAQLGRLDWDGTRVYTVVEVDGGDLTVTSPSAGDAVSSPTRVTGRIEGVDENVDVRLLAQDGGRVAQAFAPAGTEAPWSAQLTWTARDWSTGAVVGLTRSPRDGAVNRVVLVPVTRSPAASTASFAGLVDGHVSLFDAQDGRQLRQLTYPPAGTTDTWAAWSTGSLVWVRDKAPTGCSNELNRLDGTKATTLKTSTSVAFSWPQIDPLGERVAWVETPCGGGDGGHLVLTVNGTEARRYPLPTGSSVALLDVAEDGALLVRTNDREATGPGVIGLLPAAADALDGLRPLEPAPGCYLSSGAAFVGTGPVAYETCGEDVRLVRFDAATKRTSTGPSTKGEPPQSVSTQGDQLVMQLFGGDHYGAIAVVSGGRTRVVISNAGEQCSSVGSLKGCVRAPSW